MPRLAASLLAVGVMFAAGASAQSGYYGARDDAPPSVDRYGQSYGAHYDDARVIRVDPVLTAGDRRYGGYATGSQRCYTREDGVYAGGDPYYGNGGDRDRDYYGDDGYHGGDRYRGSDTGRNVATVIGGLVGAAIGSQIGGGSARYATAAVGSMVGGIAGREIYESNARVNRPRTGTVTVCDPVPDGYRGDDGYGGYPTSGVSAYDVTYEYAGRRYVTRTDYHPGDRIRVRVDVRPE